MHNRIVSVAVDCSCNWRLLSRKSVRLLVVVCCNVNIILLTS